MVHFLVLADNRAPMETYLRWWGDRRLRRRVRLISYEDVADSSRLRDGTYVFGDNERLPPAMFAHARCLWASLAARGSRVRLLNQPGVAMPRYELLRTLHDRGINQFNVHRIDDPRDRIRFPVFIRDTHEHNGALSPLLADAGELAAAIDGLAATGFDPAKILIVEFLDTRDAGGMYRKYSVMKVGARVLAHHIFFDTAWMVKATTHWPPERVLADNEFMLANPHVAEAAAIFELAGIEFGRMDYAVLGDRIQVWEINTVPTLQLQRSFYGPDRLGPKQAFAHRLNDALFALDIQRPGIFERTLGYVAGRSSVQ